MKRVLKGGEPASLITFRTANPDGTWEQMRNDPLFFGRAAYDECRQQSITDQGGLCAFCENDIRDCNPLKCRVEHFRPKSPPESSHNWALDWQNMLGVCSGGSNPSVANHDHYLEPLKENLSCDAHKDRVIQKQGIPLDCRGWILSPLLLPCAPSPFLVRKDNGFLEPDLTACRSLHPLAGNQHATVEELIERTIVVLNLNCDRLANARLRVVWDIERNKKKQREQGYDAKQALRNLADRYFQNHWHRFFTVIRSSLGHAAELHLQATNYQG